MKLLINREKILTPVQAVIGVVERRQTLPVLSNILIQLEQDTISFLTSDMEVEASFVITHDNTETGKITIPAKKFLDILKALPESEEDIEIKGEQEKIEIKAGKSRFSLTTLNAEDFPITGTLEEKVSFDIEEKKLKDLLERTQFAMAHQDVRYYLNGMLIEISENSIRTVATDGHRLALSKENISIATSEIHQIIVPRKGITEILRLLTDTNETVNLQISTNHLRAITGKQSITTKLIDGRFPDYERVIPAESDKKVIADKTLLRSGFARTSILSNEKFRGIRIVLENDKILASANNPEQEKAEEEIPVTYTGEKLEIGFNVSYLLDVLANIRTEEVILELKDTDSSCKITGTDQPESLYVIMPMRL